MHGFLRSALILQYCPCSIFVLLVTSLHSTKKTLFHLETTMSALRLSDSNNGSSVNAKLMIAFVGGILFSSIFHIGFSSSKSKDLGPTKGKVTRLADTPVRPTSHIDDLGRPITKQQLLEPFVVPNFVGYSVATFKPGQNMMPVHEHESLHEFFYVLEGTGIIQVNDVEHKVSPGTFLHMAPHEPHGIWIPKDNKGDMKMAVCGVVVGEKK